MGWLGRRDPRDCARLRGFCCENLSPPPLDDVTRESSIDTVARKANRHAPRITQVGAREDADDTLENGAARHAHDCRRFSEEASLPRLAEERAPDLS